MSFYLSKTSLKRLENIDKRLVKIVKNAIKETQVDFFVVEGFRTAERQNELFKKGLSELDGYNKKSAHQLGLAVDVCPLRNGQPLWKLEGNEKEWLEIGRAMLRSARLLGVCLEWGLTYKIGDGYDLPHFEIKE